MRTVVAIAVVGLLALAVPASAQTLYLELGIGPVDDPIPPNGADWHELYPTFCTIHTQEGYGDNGDGEVSVCDMITLSGVLYHIEWVGPTYFLYNTVTGDVMFAEPTNPDPGGNPTGETWHEIAPEFCTEWTVDDWEDNGDGIVSQCDIVWIGGEPWHIEEVNLDITVTPGSPTEKSTWGKIKGFFGDLF
jgi:hypothetical protein